MASPAIFFLAALIINTWLLLNVGGGAFFYPNVAGIVVNAASAFIVEVTLILGLLGVIYSYQYFREDREGIIALFYLLFSFFIATLILMATSFNILVIYIAFEASTVAGGILILFTRRGSATRAAVRFFILSAVGAVIILVGILYQNSLTGFILTREAFSGVPNNELVLLAALYAVGFGIKVGIFPFGLLWLPAAHSEAPTPVSAILSGVMVQVAAFAVARVIGVISPVSSSLAIALVGLGAMSVIVGSTLAAVEATLGSRYSRFHVGSVNIRGVKRVWAFSTSSEVGVFYILIGLGLLSPSLLPLFLTGILLHFLNHGLAKALLFFDSGFVIEASRIADLSLLKGMGRRLGINGFTYLIGGLSLSLFPGTLGYNTFLEFMRGHIGPEVIAVVVTGALLIFFTTIYSLRIILWGRPRVKVEYLKEQRGHTVLRLPGVVLASFILALGVIILLGSSGAALQEYYNGIEEWISLAAKTIVEPWVVGV
ncbi:MAG: complex I subunit 5 family protein [Candidatus Methanomethylicaceae archaeon]